MIEGLIEEMQTQNMSQQVVFYSNKKCIPTKLAWTLHNIASHYPASPIEIQESDFHYHFRVPNLDRQFMTEESLIRDEMRRLTDMSLRCFRELPEDDEKPRKTSDLGIWLSARLEHQLE